jgi:hypothetical protein
LIDIEIFANIEIFAKDFGYMILDMATIDWYSPCLHDDPFNFSLFPDDYSQDLLSLTPPQSPEQDLDLVDLSEFVSIGSVLDAQCPCRCPIVRDCMWSENFAVRIPDSVGQSSVLDKSNDCEFSALDNSGQTNVCSRCVGLDTLIQCVDTKSIFNNMHIPPPIASSSSLQRTSLALSARKETVTNHHSFDHCRFDEQLTVVKMEATSDFEESFGSISSSDDDCEVDVEYVSDSASDDPIPTKYVRVPISKKMLVLPASTSVSAHVAAMHNYSSLHGATSTSDKFLSSCHRASRNFKSAPQSPNTYPSIVKIKRCVASNPSSPSSRRYKRSLMSRGEKRPYARRESSLLTPPGSSDSEGELNRRALHNVLERKRRNNLKEYFNLLRDQIPKLKVEQRTSKVVILQRAKEWVNELHAIERRNQLELQRQKSYHDELMRRVMATQQRNSILNY